MRLGTVAKGIFSATLFVVMAASGTQSSYAQNKEQVSIAVLEFDRPEVVAQQMRPLLDGLNEQFSDADFTLEVLSIDELDALARGGKSAIIVSDPYHYLRLRASDRMTAAFATMYRASKVGNIGSMGGTILVSSQSADMSSLEDLRGKTVAIGDFRNTGGFVLPMAELARAGVERSDIRWIEVGNQTNAVAELIEGRVDAVFLRSSLMEAMVGRGDLDPGSVSVLNRQKLGDYPFAVSTRLHPEWPLVASRGTPPEIVARVLGVLLWRPGGRYVTTEGVFAGVNAPADYSGLESELRQLRLTPYDKPPSVSIFDIWRQHTLGVSSVLVLLVMALGLLLALLERNRRLGSLWAELQRSVKAQKADQRRLEDLNRHFELFLNRTTDFMYFKDASRRFVFTSRSFAELVGMPDRHGVEGKTDADVFPPEIAAEYLRQEDELFRSREPLVDQRQRFQRVDGSMGWMSTYKWPVFSKDNGEITGLFGISRDVTELHDYEQKLEQAAYYDALTGLPNRALFFDRLEQAMASADRRKVELAVVYMDLDKFKAINDKHGHATGDDLLMQLSQLFTSQIRRSDTVARLGGDEFVFLICDFNSRKECIALLDRLMSLISEHRVVSGIPMQVSASAGIAFYSSAMGIGPDHLLRQADQAMYRAKNSGHNLYRISNEQQESELRAFADVFAEAIDKREFELHYQPLVDIREGKIVGAEALLRWRHPERGLLFPDQFLPALIGHPLRIKVDNWVRGEALAQQARWRQAGLDLGMHVNVTALDIIQPEFVSRLREELERSNRSPASELTLEILESAAVADAQRVNAVIEECRESGVQFALDDFGTGYSSLSHIKDLRANCVKIDQRFIQSMYASYDDFALLMAILSMARAFDRKVIAEGVETVEQAEVLLFLGCSQVQGWLFSKAKPADQFKDWAETWVLPSSLQQATEEFSSLNSQDSHVGRAFWEQRTHSRNTESTAAKSKKNRLSSLALLQLD
ncbi:EAL domain-containing protein [Congregibacter sp.]|uniref:EAL domain-containing protein n=1 Tax=Congregibacter sp. TaxID=2744308 RepID=UPI003F6A8BA8